VWSRTGGERRRKLVDTLRKWCSSNGGYVGGSKSETKGVNGERRSWLQEKVFNGGKAERASDVGRRR